MKKSYWQMLGEVIIYSSRTKQGNKIKKWFIIKCLWYDKNINNVKKSCWQEQTNMILFRSSLQEQRRKTKWTLITEQQTIPEISKEFQADIESDKRKVYDNRFQKQ